MIIPAAYIPNAQKRIDFDAEAAAFLSGKIFLPDGYALPSPPAGWYTLLELITSDFFLRPLECEPEDLFAALALLNLGKRGVYAADEYRRGNTAPLRAEADRMAEEHGKAIISALDRIITETLFIPFNGLEMLPHGGPQNKPFIFDAECLADLCASVCMTTGDKPEAVMWHMPLLRAGYIRVFRARYEGEKRIARPSNAEAVRKAFADAKDREKRGILHPWQIDHPHRYYPSEAQKQARPEILAEHMALLAKEKRTK